MAKIIRTPKRTKFPVEKKCEMCECTGSYNREDVEFYFPFRIYGPRGKCPYCGYYNPISVDGQTRCDMRNEKNGLDRFIERFF